MIRSRTAAAVLAALTLVALAACKPAAPELTSPWPRADRERIVPRPPVPPRWPLTGLDAPSDAAIHKRVVSVKIENSPEAKPQVGLDQADVVYESLAEGGITRFNAIFHSKDPEYLIGPVRSARLSDLRIVPQYGAMFIFSGANTQVNNRVNGAGIQNLSQDAGIAACYERVSGRKAPHNLFVDLAKARSIGASKGWATSQTLAPFAFERRSTEATPQVRVINIPFSTAAKARWEYDPASHTYLRWDRGSLHKDGKTGKQFAARNVIVLWAKTEAVAKKDAAGSNTLDIELVGEGRATVFRDGLKLDGKWVADKKSPPKFVATDGSAIRLSPGVTWFQVIPTNQNISME